MKKMLVIALLGTGLGLGGCTKEAVKGSEAGSSDAMSMSESQAAFQSKVLEVSSLVVSVPQVVEVESSNTFSVTLPLGNNPATLDALDSVEWNFGDGSAAVVSLQPVNHVYFSAGRYTITVKAKSLAGDVVSFTSPISVLPFQERLCDLSQIKISGPSAVVAGSSSDFSADIPACFSTQVSSVTWDFGDGSGGSSNQNASHIFDNAGAFVVTVVLGGTNGAAPITLQQLVFVTAAPIPTTTTTTTLPEVVTTTTIPPTTTTVDVHPNLCNPENGPRVTEGSIFSEDVACGINGHKTLSYRQVKTEECRLNDENKYRWQVISDVKTLLSEGPCVGQTCQFGSQILNDGQSIRVFNTPTPVGAPPRCRPTPGVAPRTP